MSASAGGSGCCGRCQGSRRCTLSQGSHMERSVCGGHSAAAHSEMPHARGLAPPHCAGRGVGRLRAAPGCKHASRRHFQRLNLFHRKFSLEYLEEFYKKFLKTQTMLQREKEQSRHHPRAMRRKSAPAFPPFGGLSPYCLVVWGPKLCPSFKGKATSPLQQYRNGFKTI